MKPILAALAALSVLSCHRHTPPPPTASPKTPAASPESGPLEAPKDWSLAGSDLDKGVSFQLSVPDIHASLKRVNRPAPLDKKAWDRNPRVLSSDTDLPGLEERRVVVGGRTAYRVQYRYREFGKPAAAPFDRRAVEVFVERDASSSYEILFLFAEKDSEAALPAVDRFLESLKLQG